jgi:cytochrome c oxidase subunit 3
MTTAIATLKYQIYNRRLGLWLFMLSDSMVFLALLAARYYMQGTHRPPEVNQTLGLFLTCLLLASSFCANRADVSIAHGDRAAFLRNLAATIVLGVMFLLLVATIEWPEALHYAPPSTGFGTALFSLTGLHATHVLSGIIVLLFALFKGWRGGYAQDHWGAEGSIIYWHFVDLVWVFVYPTLYLVG